MVLHHLYDLYKSKLRSKKQIVSKIWSWKNILFKLFSKCNGITREILIFFLRFIFTYLIQKHLNMLLFYVNIIKKSNVIEK